MKKLLIIVTIIVFLLSLYKREQIIIPKEAIRFRIIANSNQEEDQQLKQEIVKQLKQEFKPIENMKTKEEAKEYLIKDLPTFQSIIEDTLKDKSYQIHYGNNTFPEKVYKEVVYEEGEYESLVITIGEGLGDNFWCVLFPPLCFIEEEDVEYKSLIKEVLEKYF